MPNPTIAQANARRLVWSAWASGIRPPIRRTVAEWADAERILGANEGPYPGPWRTERAPYLREPMEACSLTAPAERVTVRGSAQTGKTMIAINLVGQIAAESPTSVLMVVPSVDEARNFNREKLQPLIENSPAVRRKVMPVQRADEAGSTTMVKRFAGGSVELTGANSSKGLQMRTKRVILMDEVSEFPWDVDNRGDPVAMAETRALTYRKRKQAKIIKTSTPGTEGACRISAAYDESSRGVWHVPCPHCGDYQPLIFENLRWERGKPETAAYPCQACGTMIEEAEKAEMNARGRWVHERPELRDVHAGYDINSMFSAMVTWAYVAERREASEGDLKEDKVFTQQVLGRPYANRHDVVPHQILWERRTDWPPGRIPEWVVFLEGATDVQGDRLEWAVWGFDRNWGQTWVDGGILMGDPRQPEVWAKHDEVMGRVWLDAWDRPRAARSWGLDTGFLTQSVYAYCRRHVGRVDPVVMALDGRPKWGEPPIGAPRMREVDFNGKKLDSIPLWPVGTYDLKDEVMACMRATEAGPDKDGVWPAGAMRFPSMLDLGFFEQLTAEVCIERQNRAGYRLREWVKVRARNEQLDLAVYCRALARHGTVRWEGADWDAAVAEAGPPVVRARKPVQVNRDSVTEQRRTVDDDEPRWFGS
jgi:phage terminase large subunit GpA-like protein